ncbi:DUF4333 domain-containing protein [Luteococcus sp. H138]|uniref:DUF4333 domain-containing protein n=1 Tax=unclassified Luteococcus TaxID=2639923 RepID=UPI00313A9BB1
MAKPPVTAVASLLALALSITACSTSVSTRRSMEKSRMETKVSEMLTEKVGQKPDKIECPGDLKMKLNEKMICTLTAGADQLPVDVTVDNADEGKEHIQIKVGETPIPISTP